MKKFCITILCLASLFPVIAQDTLSRISWVGGTAINVAPRRWEVALLSPSRYGLSDRFEISAHPLGFFVVPQGRLKAGWIRSQKIHLASEHTLFTPTHFMELVSAKGTGGLISPEFDIPFMVAMTNSVLISVPVFRFSLFSAGAGISFSMNSASPDPRTTIDLPLIYPRLAVFYSQPAYLLSVDYRGIFLPHFGWVFRVENEVISNTSENYFMENKGVLVYLSKNMKFRAEAGYKLCFGKYPAGPQWHFLPALDLMMAF